MKNEAIQFILKSIKYVITVIVFLIIWSIIYTLFANAATATIPPLVKPYPTQENNSNWVRALTQKDTEKLSNVNNEKWKEWNRALNRQPIKSTPRLVQVVSIDDIIQVQNKCNNIFIINSKNQSQANDLYIWGKKDYWATPNEFIKKGQGDCEDFAICKYYELRKIGFNADQLNIWSGTLIFYDNKRINIDHAVLTVELNGIEYVLDNVYSNIFIAKEYMNRYFKPKYRMNEKGWSFF